VLLNVLYFEVVDNKSVRVCVEPDITPVEEPVAKF